MNTWKKTLLILFLLFIAFFAAKQFNFVEDYWEFINLIPIPTNIKTFIQYLKRRASEQKPPSQQNYQQPHSPNHPQQNHQQQNHQQQNHTKTEKRNVSQLHKKMVASNQGWKCNACFAVLDYTYEIDHIMPLYKGGDNSLSNLQALCRNCHGKKTVNDQYK